MPSVHFTQPVEGLRSLYCTGAYLLDTTTSFLGEAKRRNFLQVAARIALRKHGSNRENRN